MKDAISQLIQPDAQISSILIVNLAVMELNVRTVNSGVRRFLIGNGRCVKSGDVSC
jgi:hypothetical protein